MRTRSMFGMMLADALCQLDLQFRGRAEAEALLTLLHHGLAHCRVVVPHDHRAPGQHVIDIALALAVKNVGPLAALNEDRSATHRFESTYR